VFGFLAVGVRDQRLSYRSAAKLRSIDNPTRWLFSGWNCVEKTFSSQIAEENGVG
jgi:hypothetical protein